MARIRYLKPEFFEDEHLAEHPFWLRLLFAGLWNIADKSGRLEDRPKRIKAKIFPYDNVNIEKGLSELNKIKSESKRAFICRYEAGGERYIQIVNWDKHQKPHNTEKESIIPAPPKYNILLKEKRKGMVNGECENRKPLTPNGEITVKKPLKKCKYMEYVYLTNEEYKKLIEKYGEVNVKEFIENLNDYIGSKGKKYKSHYYTILSWAKKEGNNPDNLSWAEKKKRGMI